MEMAFDDNFTFGNATTNTTQVAHETNTTTPEVGISDITIQYTTISSIIFNILSSTVTILSELNMIGINGECLICANSSIFGNIEKIVAERTYFTGYFIHLADGSIVGSITHVSLVNVNISLDFLTAVYSDVQDISMIYIDEVIVGQDFISLNPNATLPMESNNTLINGTLETNGTNATTSMMMTSDNGTSITTIDFANISVGGCIFDLNLAIVRVVSDIEMVNGSADCMVNSYETAIGILSDIMIETALFTNYFIFAEKTTISTVMDIDVAHANIYLDFFSALDTKLAIITSISLTNVTIGQFFSILESTQQENNETAEIINDTISTNDTIYVNSTMELNNTIVINNTMVMNNTMPVNDSMVLNDTMIDGNLTYYFKDTMVNINITSNETSEETPVGITDIELVNVSIAEIAFEILYSSVSIISDIKLYETYADCLVNTNGSSFGTISDIVAEYSEFTTCFVYFAELTSVYDFSQVSLTNVNISLDFLTAVSSTIQVIADIFISETVIGKDLISLNSNNTSSDMNGTMTNSTNATTLTTTMNGTEIMTIELDNVTVGEFIFNLNIANIGILSMINTFNSSAAYLLGAYGSKIDIFSVAVVEQANFSDYFMFAETSAFSSITELQLLDVNISLDFLTAVDS